MLSASQSSVMEQAPGWAARVSERPEILEGQVVDPSALSRGVEVAFVENDAVTRTATVTSDPCLDSVGDEEPWVSLAFTRTDVGDTVELRRPLADLGVIPYADRRWHATAKILDITGLVR